MNIFKIPVLLSFLVVLLAACNNAAATPMLNPTNVFKTAEAIAQTEVAIAQVTSVPVTPLPVTPISMTFEATLTPGPWGYLSIPPKPDEQAYIDPEGWYAVNFPAKMQVTDKPNVFIFDRVTFFETGYLSQMGYVSNINIVCAWLANVELKSERNKVGQYLWTGGPRQEPSCSVSPIKDAYISYKVIENPGADPEHRFIYIKTTNGEWLKPTFSWIRTPIITNADLSLAPLSFEETSFWDKAAALPPGVSVKEYVLPLYVQGAGPREEENLLFYVPEEALPDSATAKTNTFIEPPTVKEQLKTIGYKLTPHDPFPQLYRDGKILFGNVYKVSDVYKFSTKSGAITAFTVATMDKPGSSQFAGYLIQNDSISLWPYNHQDPPFAPVLYQDELLWLRAAEDGHVQVVKSDKTVVYTFAVYDEPVHTVKKFMIWDGHWIMFANDFLIQDGEILNGKLGFDEIFHWSLIKDKPVYFFRKGSRIGLSYDGQILPLQYGDVAHGLCCGFASNNPNMVENTLRFFGKRDGVWYYVVVKFN